MEGPMIIRRAVCATAIASAATFALACGSRKAPESAAAPVEREEPPRILQRGNPPELRVYNIPASGRPALRLQIAVMVDSLGRPDMTTLSVTGVGAPENRQAIENWLQQVIFRSARRGGKPVAGMYRTSFQVRIETRMLSP
jgi:hypothetical protein